MGRKGDKAANPNDVERTSCCSQCLLSSSRRSPPPPPTTTTTTHTHTWSTVAFLRIAAFTIVGVGSAKQITRCSAPLVLLLDLLLCNTMP
jgi:hypothetical protein